VTAVLVLGGVAWTYRTPNVAYATGSAWYCLPGTYAAQTEQVEDGFIEPSDEAVRQEMQRRRVTSGTDAAVDEILVRSSLRQPKFKDLNWFSCSSYLGLIINLMWAFLTSIVMAGLFLAARWVADGFRKAG
jgi:hypothetical protein